MVFMTVLCGVAVYVCGQLFLKLCIEPAMELRGSIGEVAFLITLYGDAGAVPEPMNVLDEVENAPGDDPASDAAGQPALERNALAQDLPWTRFRSVSGELTRALWKIPLYRWWADAGIVPSRSLVEKTSMDLIRVSDYLRQDNVTAAGRLMVNIQRDLLGPKSSK